MSVSIHIVNWNNRRLYEEEVDTYHRIRHRIYIEELKWPGLIPRSDGREIDQFDLDTTTHFLATRDGRVIGGARLNRTTGPHLLGDVFPHLAVVTDGPPRDPRILEWTRVFVLREERKRDGEPKVSDVLIASLMEHSLEVGATALTTVMATYWLPWLHGYGWQVQPLCVPTLHDGEWLMGGKITVSPAALAAIRTKAGIKRSSLIYRGCRPEPLEEVRHAVLA